MYVLVTPLLGEVIDLDERRYGVRRDATFNALHAVMVKSAQIISIVIAAALMSLLGNSVEKPTGVFLVGPVGGLICIVGLGAAWFYPILNPLKTTANDLDPKGDSL